MPTPDILIKGAREHNLRDVDLVIPRNQLICLTGVSGSGKSSLAFDTLYAEGQRRYVESLSSFARQFLGQMPKPDVDLISGLSPSISISQKTAGSNPRSTVGTITEIYDYLRVMFARVGDGHCPKCGQAITAQTREQILARILTLPAGTEFSVLAPLIRGQKGEHRDLFIGLLKQGFIRARVDGQIVSLSADPRLDRQMRHNIEVVVDRLSITHNIKPRLAEAVDSAIKLGKGGLIVALEKADAPSADETSTDEPSGRGQKPNARKRPEGDIVLSVDYACTDCGISFEPPSPQLFSFNSPQGMCLECDGLGEVFTFDVHLLIPDPSHSFKAGCFQTIEPWKDLGRWRRHIFQGVADTIERKRELPAGTMLETPWQDLAPDIQHLWLWGTGDEHMTFTWRGGTSPQKYGGKFEGIIPELLSKYRNSRSQMQLRQLEQLMNSVDCQTCQGARLNPQARSVSITTASERFAARPNRTLPEVCHLSVADAVDFFSELRLDQTRAIIATEVLKEIRGRLGFLMNVGLEYLSLDRSAPTLSGGESQRIRLAGQIGCGLVGVLYILDEPSIGLHPRDNDRLIKTLGQLRDLGNTVIVVEHDEDTMRASDHIIDFGPGPGVRGGEVVATGDFDAIVKAQASVTGKYLSGERCIPVPAQRRIPPGTQYAGPSPEEIQAAKSDEPPVARRGRKGLGAAIETKSQPATNWLSILGAAHNNLKNIDTHIPLGAFVCITGVSGSGKSSLVNDILVQALHRDLNRGDGHPGTYDAIVGLQHLDKLIDIDQSPIGRTPRSNPGTYIKLFDEIRDLFTRLPESKQRGYKPGRFSFNVEGGRCEACEGHGSTRLEMDFLADVWVTCPVCQGQRFNRETLGVKFKDRSIADVLNMDVQQALELFENIPKVRHKLETLHGVGLDYLKIGQPSPTLSGGEAQRTKLARELVKKSTGRTLYLLDEPTTGLHFADIEMLLKVLHDFVDAGNTVIVVEHNLDVIKTADWIIDLGPEGGDAGGQIVATGTPEEVMACPQSYTGVALAKALQPKAPAPRRGKQSKRANGQRGDATHIEVKGARQHNLKDVDVSIPRDEITVFCGPSGSGKSSLAMDTIYAEGQRRYVESLSSYARQFVSQMQKPLLESIEGLSPAIAIEQQNLGHTPRSTVGTSTEIYDYLRILMARIGTSHCPRCDTTIGTQTSDQIVDKVLAMPEGTKLYLMAPVNVDVGDKYESLWDELRSQGYARVRVDGFTYELDKAPQIDRRRKHTVEVVIDRIVVKEESRTRIAESVESALAMGRGVVSVAQVQDGVAEPRWPVRVHSQYLVCETCGRSFEPLTPHNFSFNSHLGWCESCQGLGTQTGANPSALIEDERRSLAEGALRLWPSLDRTVSQRMLEALADTTGLPTDLPFAELEGRHRRLVMYGTGDTWIPVHTTGKSAEGTVPIFQFQFKGLYPALEVAARLSPSLRSRLDYLVGEIECGHCGGSRLRDDASAVRFRAKTIDQFCRMPLGALRETIKGWKLDSRERKIAGDLINEIQNRVEFLNDVGLEYLTLARSAASLSGGEAQRIRLASQLGSGLSGVLYVLDEPTIGLHPRDNQRLIRALHKLRDLGNTLVLVEHDREVIEGSDHVIDFGPAAGQHGGQIVAKGTPAKVGSQRSSVTGPYLTGKKVIPIPENRRISLDEATQIKGESDFSSANGVPGAESSRPQLRRNPGGSKTRPQTPRKKTSEPPRPVFNRPFLTVRGARHNNLRFIDVRIPLGALTAITGVSGSGKSSLINDVLYASLAKTLHRANIVPGAHDKIEGIEHINKVVRVDQQPLGNSPSSNPATYTGVFELIRTLFAQLPESKLRGFTTRRFSFNVPGGRCEACEGNGQKRIEMHFLPDVWVTCETCRGRRYNEETLSVKFHGNSIAEVLGMTCAQAVALFGNLPKIRRTLQTLCDVGLDYLTLGQPAPTLSGGEAQRVKLAAELSRPDTGRTLYLLDEPTTGLHFSDLAKLLDVLNRLVDIGNTVVVIEHNLDVIKTADWIIDIGPEAGDGGGRVVVEGTPEQVVAIAGKPPAVKSRAAKNGRRNGKGNAATARIEFNSLTAQALAPALDSGRYVKREVFNPAKLDVKSHADIDIEDVGKDALMPWQVNGRAWHTQDRVGRNGEKCRWDGRILEKVVDRIHELGEFNDTNWNSRTIVEITGKTASHGWFLHAITGEMWLLKLKFRMAKKTFRRETIQQQIPLKPLNEMHDLPIYGNEPRVIVKQMAGPWQEIEIRGNTLDEIDTAEFWSFLESAVVGFQEVTERVATNPEDLMPWKKLGEKWHYSKRGFPIGKQPVWDHALLDGLITLLQNTARRGRFVWDNQSLVHFVPEAHQQPWATVHTKRVESLDLSLSGPKNQFGLGRIAAIGYDRAIDTTGNDRDVVKLRFRKPDELKTTELHEFVAEHFNLLSDVPQT